MPIAYLLDRFARMHCSIAINGDIGYTQVNTEHTFHVDGLGLVNLAGGEQIPSATDEGQIGFAASGCE
jgi:hypothetical protein